MGKETSYTGIDAFRLPAALLVVAIHTSPLASVWATGDFVLTRILARVAVPFFFMASGFFLFLEEERERDPGMGEGGCAWKQGRSHARLKRFLKKTARLYGFSILLYLPLNCYNGYFEMESLGWNMIKDLVFDGTFYHLWYLPASMAGAAIACGLWERLGKTRVLAVSSALYLAGLFGDSYYGAAREIPALRALYEGIFRVSDYTRNGIFFAPVFFALGGIAAGESRKAPLGACQGKVSAGECKNASLRADLIGLAVSFALMSAEAAALHEFGLPRHDSMYLFLPPCVYFLFCALLPFRGKRLDSLATVSLVIYVVHPMAIVAVRLAARALRLWGLLVENSLAHALAVCVVSMGVGTAAAFWKGLARRRRGKRHRAGT